MRSAVELADVRPCRWCGVDALRVLDVDGDIILLDPMPVLGEDVARFVGPARVPWGWRLDGRYWRRHNFAAAPHRYGFRDHPCADQPARKGTTRMTTPDPFGTAAPPGASGPAMAELEGKLLLVTVNAIERGIVTAQGVADAAKVDLVDLTSGEVHANAALWGKVLVNQLTAGVKYVGRIIKGQATGSNNPPWTWVDGDANDKATAVRYLTYAASQSVATQAAPAPAAQAPAAAPAFTPPAAAPVAAPPAAAAPPWAQ